jgi:hypothetical protein
MRRDFSPYSKWQLLADALESQKKGISWVTQIFVGPDPKIPGSLETIVVQAWAAEQDLKGHT